MKVSFHEICLGLLMMGSALVFNSCKHDDDDPEFLMSNQEFVNRASSSNQFEISAGAMAASKGENEAVKTYGEHMVTDHTAAALEMKNLANGKGWDVPNSLLQKEKQHLDQLSHLTGPAFDKEFANIMVMSHQDAVSLFEAAAGGMGVPDADLRTMANAKLPTLKMHLEHAITLKNQVNP